MEKFGVEVQRHGERDVVLRNGAGDVLHGTQFYEFVVDIPPLVEVGSVSVTWYREVWQRRGWSIEGAD